MTVGELKKALEGVPDDVVVTVDDRNDDEVVAHSSQLNTPSKSHAVWDDKNITWVDGATFWIGAA